MDAYLPQNKAECFASARGTRETVMPSKASCDDLHHPDDTASGLSAAGMFPIDNLILNSMREGVQWIDQRGVIVYENPAAARLLGWEPQEMIGRLGHQTMHHTHVDGTAYPVEVCPIYHGLLTGESCRVDNEVFWRKDGTSFPVEYTATPVWNAQNEIIGSIILFTDITERKSIDETLHQEREFLGALLESLSDSIVVCDETGALRVFNETTRRFTDLPENPVLPQQWPESFGLYQLDALTLLRPEEVPLFRALQGEIVHEAPMFIRRMGEPERHLIANGQAMWSEQGRKLGAVIAMRDVTETRAAEASLREQEQHLRLALESSGFGSYLLDLASGHVLVLSDTCRLQFGWPPEMQVTRADFLSSLHPDDLDGALGAFQRAVQGVEDYHAEYRMVRADGSHRWISAHGRVVRDAAGQPTRMVGVTQDVTERKQQEVQQAQALREAEERADRDPLTGLWNHRAFHARFAEEASRAEREGTSLAVVLLDLNNFKFFNDTHGHLVGDEVLRQVSQRILEVCRPYDTVARYGGDEFALLLPGVTGSAEEVEARLRSDLTGLTYLSEAHRVMIPITLSLGAGVCSSLDLDRQEVVQRADTRLRRVKAGGEVETEADQVRSSAGTAVAGFSMLDALVTAVDNKDRYTCRHSEDVLNYSLMIGRRLGLDEAQQRTIAVSALLHDVGKIGVPDAILRKPGKLTDEEFAAIQQHPSMGAALVSTVPGLEGTLDAVRHHHERWDGAGYPSGLKGSEIPLIARLMAVADAFSAMTTDRPYRQGMERVKALSILEDGAGSQWDPECVAAFIQALPRHFSQHQPRS
ncbi:MAG: HD domain-containing phosphohydrolase [Janthinobacterium lividum]